MALIDRTIYPRIPTSISPQELHEFYTPTEEEISFARWSVRGDSSVMNFLSMLKVFQNLHYFPHPVEMPLAVTQHVHACLGLTEIPYTAYPPRSLYRHQKTIRAFVHFSTYDRAARHLVGQTVYEAVLKRDDPADLINVAVAELVRTQYELPAFSTLERMVKRLRQFVNNGYFGRVFALIEREDQERLIPLMAASGSARFSAFHRLKEPPGQASLTNLREWFNRLDYLEGLGEVEKWLQAVPLLKIKSFAAQAKIMTLNELTACAPAKRYTLLVCLILHLKQSCRDSLIEMFIKRMAFFHKRGQQTLELLHERQRDMSEELISTLSEILEVAGPVTTFDFDSDEAEDEEGDEADVDEGEQGNLSNETKVAGEDRFYAGDEGRKYEDDVLIEETPHLKTSPVGDGSSPTQAQEEQIQRLHQEAKLGRQVQFLLSEHGGVETLVEACQAITAYKGNNYLPLLPRLYKSHRGVLLRLLERLEPQSATADSSLHTALEYVLTHRASRARWGKDELNLSFASDLWRKNVRVRKPRKRKYRLDRRMLEICVLSYVAFELKTGDMYVAGSDDYADYRTQLLSWKECEPLVEEYCRSLDLPASSEAFVTYLRQTLTERVSELDETFLANETLTINQAGRLSLKKTLPDPASVSKSEANALLTRLHQRLAPRGLLQILAHAEHWCGFTRQFGPFSGSETKIERTAAIERYILTVFAYGTGLGPVQTAAHFAGGNASANSEGPGDNDPALATTTVSDLRDRAEPPTNASSGQPTAPGGVNSYQLGFLNRAHLSTAKLEAANTLLINTYSRFELPLLWGDPKVETKQKRGRFFTTFVFCGF